MSPGEDGAGPLSGHSVASGQEDVSQQEPRCRVMCFLAPCFLRDLRGSYPFPDSRGGCAAPSGSGLSSDSRSAACGKAVAA